MRFHKTNEISQNFSGVVLCFCSVAMYFVDFRVCFRYFKKMTAKFQFCSNKFEILKFQTWQRQKLKSKYRSYLQMTLSKMTHIQNNNIQHKACGTIDLILKVSIISLSIRIECHQAESSDAECHKNVVLSITRLSLMTYLS